MSEKTQEENNNPSLPNESFKKKFIENGLSLGWALLLVFIIRSSLFEPFQIPSGSMIPTLLVGDKILVNKMSYGLRVPFTEWLLDSPLYFFRTKNPARGDIIVFKYPEDPSIYYIKRIVGIPGDRIEMKNKVVYINGKPHERNPVSDAEFNKISSALTDGSSDVSKEYTSVYHDKFDNTTGTIMIDSRSRYSLDMPEIQVPEGHYFVMGDNRDNSNDSRVWGYVPFDYIKGNAVLIWISFWMDFDKKSFTFHPERIGTLLQ
jgi:signal peptidase I